VLTSVCVCMCSVFWLLWFKLSVLAKRLAGKTPPRKPFRSKEIISTKPGRRALMTFFVFVYCFIVLLFVCLVPSWSPALYNTFHTPMARHSLFLLKVPLHTNQRTSISGECTYLLVLCGFFFAFRSQNKVIITRTTTAVRSVTLNLANLSEVAK